MTSWRNDVIIAFLRPKRLFCPPRGEFTGNSRGPSPLGTTACEMLSSLSQSLQAWLPDVKRHTLFPVAKVDPQMCICPCGKAAKPQRSTFPWSPPFKRACWWLVPLKQDSAASHESQVKDLRAQYFLRQRWCDIFSPRGGVARGLGRCWRPSYTAARLLHQSTQWNSVFCHSYADVSTPICSATAGATPFCS